MQTIDAALNSLRSPDDVDDGNLLSPIPPPTI
jgi:hypothetical protein